MSDNKITEEWGVGYYETLRMMSCDLQGNQTETGFDGPASDEENQILANQIYRLYIVALGGEGRINEYRKALVEVGQIVTTMWLKHFGDKEEEK